MKAEKSVSGLLRGLPPFIRMEETRGLGRTFKNQWGGGRNTAKILYKIITGGQGFVGNMKDLSRVKVGRVVPNWILGMWETFPDREAVVDGDKRYTFGELRQRVLKLANGIQGLGVRPKDAVAVMIYNSAEFLECLCGLSLIGATMPFVNWHLRGEELKTTINLRSPKILIFDAEFMDEIVKIKEGLETVKYFVVVGDFSSLPSGIISYEDLLATQPTTRPEVNFLAALNPYTGGTTGTPKSSNLYDSFGYMLSDLAEAPRASFESYLQYTSKAFSYFYWFGGDSIADPIEKNIRTLLVTPMYHAGTAAGWGPCFMMGATALIMRKFDPEEFLAMIDRERANWVFVAPTILQRVLALPEGVKEKYDLSAMRTIICAAAPCPPQVKKDINELFIRQGAPQPVFGEYYGSAETAIVTVLLPRDYVQDPNRINGVGKARCGDLKIYNEEESRWADTGEVGKIMCRTASTLALRYPGSEDRLHESIRIIEGEEWYDDGLLGYLDKDGFLYLTGRVKEMIISGGVNVYPMEIEEVILKHPDVFDAAVVRLPHPDLGEVPIACVQLLEGRRLSEEDLIDFCKQEGLRGYKLPARVEFLEELPRHIDGKIIKRELEARYWEGEEAKG